MFNNLSLPTKLKTNRGDIATIVADGGGFLFGFIKEKPLAQAWDKNNGYHISGISRYFLQPPFNVKAEAAKLEPHVIDALMAFMAIRKKITGIKFLREIYKQAGRATSLSEIKALYEHIQYDRRGELANNWLPNMQQ